VDHEQPEHALYAPPQVNMIFMRSGVMGIVNGAHLLHLASNKPYSVKKYPKNVFVLCRELMRIAVKIFGRELNIIFFK
jgi:hypothetical protein